MAFEKVIGQKRVKEILTRAVERERLGHAYLFYGPEGVGKDATALELARGLNCAKGNLQPCDHCQSCKMMATLQHPDVKFIFPMPSKAKEGEIIERLRQKAADPYYEISFPGSTSISIERIRELRRDAALHSFSGKYRIVIISEADKMTIEACNAVLKILEEPATGMILILTTAKLNRLLPTIVSRCQPLRFDPLRAQEIEEALRARAVGKEKAKFIARLAMGNFKKALNLCNEDLDAKREEALEFLRIGLSGGVRERMELVEKLVAQRDRGKVKDLLNLLLLCVRDITMIYELNENHKEVIINTDKTDVLHSLARTYNLCNWEKTMSEIEKSIDLIDKNIYINLILIVLLNNLGLIRGK